MAKNQQIHHDQTNQQENLLDPSGNIQLVRPGGAMPRSSLHKAIAFLETESRVLLCVNEKTND